MAKKRSGRVSNIKELNKEINKLLIKALNDDRSVTANVIKETESDMVEREVYAKYTSASDSPYKYVRRGRNGGLADTSNMEHEAAEVNDKVKMIVVNMTEGQADHMGMNSLKPGQLADLVEGGDGKEGYGLHYAHQGDGTGEYLDSRPFQEETVRTLNDNNDHMDALRLDLMMKGVNVK